VGDLGLIKLCGALLDRPADVADTARLLARYGDWAGLAGAHLLSLPLAHTRTRSRQRLESRIGPRRFTLLRALRGTAREIVGCYHSHPNGRAEPSRTDVAGGSESGFIWLIAGIAIRARSLEASPEYQK